MMLYITAILMGILEGAEVDLFIPSFPELQRVFQLSPFMVELTLSVNLVTHCITSLFVGNLGDRYGRRPILIVGLIIFAIGSILCVIATQYWCLLLGRALQGIGVSAPAVLAYLVIADMYSPAVQQRMMGVLNGTITLAMACAPVVGSYVNLYFGWQGNFLVLLGLSLICLVMGIIYLPETKTRHHISMSLREYLPILRSKKAMYHVITICLFSQVYWIFIGIAPILYMEGLGVSLEKFGFYQGSLAGVFAIFSLMSGYFLRKFGARPCFRFGIGLIIVYIFAAIGLIILDVRDPIIITLVLQVLSIGEVFPSNILWPISLEAVPNARGRIAALIVATRLILTSIGLEIVGYFYQGAFKHVGIAMCIALVAALWACHRLSKIENFFQHDLRDASA